MTNWAKRSRVAVVILCAAAAGCRSLPAAGAGSHPPATIPESPPAPAWSAPGGTFLVIYRPGPAWVQGKPVSEQPLRDHGRYLLSLFVNGTLRAAGPFTDDTGGAVVLQVPDEAHALALVVADPAVKTGIFTYEIHPWGLVPWEQHVK